MMRTSLCRLFQALTLWLIVLLIGCGGGGSKTVLPDPTGPDPDTNGGAPGPNPDDGSGGSGGGGGGGGIPTTDADIRFGTTDGNGVVTLPAFAKSAASSRGGKVAAFQLADQFGSPLTNVLVVNIRQGNEFVGAIIPNDASRAPRFFFSQKIPDRVISADEPREGAVLTSAFGTPVSSAINIAVEGDKILVKLNLEADAAIDASGLATNARYFIDNDLLNRVLAFGQYASYEGVFSQAQLGNKVADTLDAGGGYLYMAGLVEEGALLSNWRLGAALETNPNDPSFAKFLDPITAGGTQNTYFQQQLAVASSATRATIRSAFDSIFASGPISSNLGGGQRYILISAKPGDAVPGYTGENQNVLIAVPVAPRALSLGGTDNTNIFQVNQAKSLLETGDYAAGSSLALAPNPVVNDGLSGRVALTMTPLRSGDVLTRPGFPPALTAVDELQRNLKATYFIPDYFGDPNAYPQGQLLADCQTCLDSPLFIVVGPNGSITNLPPNANLGLIEPVTGSGRLVNNELDVSVSPFGSNDPDGSITKLTIDWGDNSTDDVRTAPVNLDEVINHTYTSAGTFTITLTLEDDGNPLGVASDTVQVTAIANANPVLCLTQSIPEIVDGEVRGVVPFSPEFIFSCSEDSDSDIFATGKISVIFGDGPKLENEPFATYANSLKKPYTAEGEYTLTVTLKDIDGGTDVFTVLVVVEPPAVNQLPIAVAEADPTSGEAPLTVNFSSANSSDPDGTITSTIWNFGDPAVSGGGVSIVPNPTYTYVQPDAIGDGYTATLLVVDNSGLGNPLDRSTDTVLITVTEPANLPPVVDIDAPPVAEVGQPIQFSSAGTTDPEGNNLVTYAWDFGDGTQSAEANPIHTYANPPEEGFFFVTLQVTDDGAPPKTGFGEAQVQVIAAFDDAAPFAIIEPQGPTFGVGTLSLNLDASASFSPKGATITNYAWQFTDDNSTDSGSTVSHDFTIIGNHSVILTVTDSDGRMGSAAIPVFVADSPPFGLGARVVARASANPLQAAVGQPFQFSSVGTHDPEGEPIEVIGWDFGDTTTSTEENPTHSYAAPGLYLATMVASEALPEQDMARWVSATVLVRVVEGTPNIPPVGLASATPMLIPTAPGAVDFTVLYAEDPDGVLEDSNFIWNFGDGGIDIGQTVQYTYLNPGTYEAFVTITDSLGASTQTNLTIAVGDFTENVNPLVDIVVGEATLVTVVETDVTLDMSASLDFELEELTWSIDWGDGTTPDTTVTAVHQYTDAGKYTISVQGFDPSGGRTTRTFDILVANP